MACTRMAARATRSLTMLISGVSPHSASCCPTARITWSGASRSEMMPPWGVLVTRSGRLPSVELPADPFGHRGRGQQPVVPPAPAALPPAGPAHRDLHPDAGQPAGGQAVGQARGQRPGGEHHRLGPRFWRVELLDHGQAGRRPGRERPGVQAAGQPVRVLPRVAEPAGHVADRQRGEIPERAQAHIRIEDTIVQGDKAVVRVVLEGTHTGEGLGVAPTGHRVHIAGMIMVRIAGDQLVEAWNSWDQLGFASADRRDPGATFRSIPHRPRVTKSALADMGVLNLHSLTAGGQ